MERQLTLPTRCASGSLYRGAGGAGVLEDAGHTRCGALPLSHAAPGAAFCMVELLKARDVGHAHAISSLGMEGSSRSCSSRQALGQAHQTAQVATAWAAAAASPQTAPAPAGWWIIFLVSGVSQCVWSVAELGLVRKRSGHWAWAGGALSPWGLQIAQYGRACKNTLRPVCCRQKGSCGGSHGAAGLWGVRGHGLQMVHSGAARATRL